MKLDIGSFILIGGISIVLLLCWAWLPFALIAKFFRLGDHRKQGGLLPVRATADEVRYRAEGFVPPPQVLRRDPHAFNPEVRHHEFLKVDPRLAEQKFQNPEDRDAHKTTSGLGGVRSGDRRPRTGERRKKSAGSAAEEMNSHVQKPEATLSRNREQEWWEKPGRQVEEQQ